MKITGELLKAERNKKSLTVQDVAFALKLSSKIISSIESGQIDQLPAKTFIRGFVKSYAQYLKMDVDLVMRQFQEEMGSTHPLPKNPLPPTVNSEPQSQTSKPVSNNSLAKDSNRLRISKSGKSTFVYLGVAVVLVIFIVITNRVVDHYQKETVVDPHEISKVQPLDPNLTESTQPQKEATLSSDTTSGSTTESQAAKSTAQPTSTPVVVSSNNVADESFEPSSGKPVELIIEAKKDVEIMYARGNSRNFSKLKLASKQVQVIRSPVGLLLKSDDGGSFHLVVNGIDKGLAGTNNKPVKLSF